VLLNTFACEVNKRIHTPISRETIIDTNEQEIVFDKPFKLKRQVVRVCFEYSDNLKISSYGDVPRFSDGTSLKLITSVVNQNGRKYELSKIGTSFENTICLEPELTDEWIFISKTKITFTKLLVYSNRKINISKIEWWEFNPWAWDF
jgi:hypothetical protein